MRSRQRLLRLINGHAAHMDTIHINTGENGIALHVLAVCLIVVVRFQVQGNNRAVHKGIIGQPRPGNTENLWSNKKCQRAQSHGAQQDHRDV